MILFRFILIRQKPEYDIKRIKQTGSFEYIGSQTDKRVRANWKKSHQRVNHYLSLRCVQDFIKNNLKYGYSPQIISHLLKTEHDIPLSHETIYIYIYSHKRKLWNLLLRRSQGRISRNPFFKTEEG